MGNSQLAVISLLTLALSSTVLGTVITAISGNLRSAADARRARYAEVVQSVAAWVEYPYRIRRRVDDNPSTLSELAQQGHALQERLAENRAWVAAESGAVSAVLDECMRILSGPVSASCQAAWREGPVEAASEMNLGDFGPRGYGQVFSKLQVAISYRFGVRRLLWDGAAKQRIERRCPSTPILSGRAEYSTPANDIQS